METWSQEQDQPMPFIGNRNFYDLSNEGLADIVLPILVRREAINEIQDRTALRQISEIVAYARMHTLHTLLLEDAHERSERNHETLLQELAESRTEVIGLRVCHMVCERHLLDNGTSID